MACSAHPSGRDVGWEEEAGSRLQCLSLSHTLLYTILPSSILILNVKLFLNAFFLLTLLSLRISALDEVNAE